VAATPLAPEAEAIAPRRSPVRRGLLHGRGLLGLTLVGIVVAAGLLAPLIAPYGATQQLADGSLLGPSGTHLLGTDEAGRDVLSRLLFGIRVDLVAVFIAVPVGAALGSLIGLVATMWGSVDTIAQRTFDLILAFPALILALTLTTMIGPGLLTVSIVIVLAEVPVFGRLVRTSVLTVRELPYVEAATVAGAGRWWVLRRHVMPNSLEPLTVQLAISMSVAVFVEGAMSYLGIGVRPPTPSLGSLINDGMRNIYVAKVQVVGPLVAVVMLVLGFLLISQSLASARRG
jgi:peptide/nickel transport system permease protein